MRVIISSEQRKIWVDCQNTSTRNLRADTKQQQASRKLKICPGPWERKMKEAMGQTGDLRKVDLRTTTARQLLNHEGSRSSVWESDHRRHNVFQDQQNINACESVENVLHSGLSCFVGITQPVWGYWGCIQVLTLFTHSLPWAQQKGLVTPQCSRVSTAILWAI